jgi:hypothetical protein
MHALNRPWRIRICKENKIKKIFKMVVSLHVNPERDQKKNTFAQKKKKNKQLKRNTYDFLLLDQEKIRCTVDWPEDGKLDSVRLKGGRGFPYFDRPYVQEQRDFTFCCAIIGRNKQQMGWRTKNNLLS